MASSLPTVAIIGRANAGKSSLFNRFVGHQEAVVAREAGTTRDNVIRKIHRGEHNFWLVDTAGLKKPSDEFEANIQDQIEEASNAADVILVIVDSIEYPGNADRDLAKKALKTGKPVILVLNKTDLRGSLTDEEFRNLGIKTIVRTSAEHARGIDQLTSEIIRIIPAVPDSGSDDTLRIALIGRPNVGKSRLFNALAGKQQALVANAAGTTRDVNRVSIRYKERTIELLDTAGVRKPGRQEVGIEKFSVLRTMQAIEEATVCLLVMDATEMNTSLDQRLAGMIDEAGKGLVIVVSKWDLVDDSEGERRNTSSDRVSEAFKFIPWAPLIFVSGMTGQNITKLFELALDIERRRLQPTKTRALNTLLQRAITEHPPAGLKNSHPKLRYMVQTDTNPPWFVIYGSHLRHLHWSYKRYLERLLRETYDYTGTPVKFSFRDQKRMQEHPKQED